MRKTACFRLLFLLSLLPTVCHADPMPLFKRYVTNIRPAEYGGESQIWAIESDPRGFVYLAAGPDLIVWDGYLYTKYGIDDYSVIRDLKYDSSTGRLYCAGDNFFGYWVMSSDGRMHFTSLYSNRDFSRSEIFWRIVPKDGALYLQSHDEVCICESGRLEQVAEGSVGYLFETGGRLYVQLDGRLCRIDGRHLEPLSEPIDDRLVLVDETAAGSFVILGETTGFSRLVPRDGRDCRLETIFPAASALLAGLKSFSAVRRREGGWIVGTVLDGAYLIGPDGSVEESVNSSAGLRYTTVLSLAETSSGDLMLGADGGLATIRCGEERSFYHTSERKIGYVYAASLWNENLYLGTNKGLFRVDSASTDGEPAVIAGTQGQIWDLHRCGSELLVFGDRGLYALDGGGNYRLVLAHGWKIAPIPGRRDLFCASDSGGLVMMGLDEEERLRPLYRLKNYDNPGNTLFFDKYGYAWAEQLRGSVRKLSFDMDYTEVRSCRSYRVGRDPETAIRVFPIDGEVLFVSGRYCYVYSPHADSLVMSRYYTDLFSGFGTSELNLYQQGNVFFNYVGNTVDAIVRTGSETRILRDVFSSSGLDHLPRRFRRVFAWDEETAACGFSECVGIVRLREDRSQVVPKVTLYGLDYTRHGKRMAARLPAEGGLVLPHGVTDLRFRICAAPRAALDYRVDGGQWQQVPVSAPVPMPYLAGGSHLLEIRFGTGTLLAEPFFIRRHMMLRWWFLMLLLAAVSGLTYGGWALYRMRMRRFRRQFEARQQELIEKEQVCHQNEMLSLELKERDKKLSMLALNDITVNNMLREILAELDAATDDANRRRLRPVRKCIERYMRDNGTWNNFEQYFNGIFDGFFDRLLARYPRLTNNDIKICAYVKLGMNTKEIASLMNIEISSAESARYRLRKNMGLAQTDSLTEIISKI